MKLFDRIYELTYLPLVTPSDLLDNMKLSNYKSINFLKHSDNVVAEVECFVDKKLMLFYYVFNEKDFLQQIYCLDNGEKEILFDRQDELNSLRVNYQLNKKTS